MSQTPTVAAKWSKVALQWLPFADAASVELPLPRLLRLALFQVSVGMATVLLSGTLNRVMIVELGVSAWLVALMIAVPLLIAPFRAVIGHRSDTHRSVLGWRRVPFIWFGTLMQFGGLAIMPFALILMSRADVYAVGVGASMLAFLLTGAGLHTTQTAGLALATDLAPADKRPRAVALLYVMLLAGMMIAALAIGSLLVEFSATRLAQVIQGAAVITFILNLTALWKQEARRPRTEQDNAPKVPFRVVWHEFMRRPNAARLMLAVGLGAAAFAMQDALLEPYGGEILGLSVGATTGLTGGWAFGALLGFTLAGRAMSRRADPLRMAGYGAASGIVAFLMVLFSAPFAAPGMLALGAVAIGLGIGLFSVGTLVATMALAEEGGAGLTLGIWGAVQACCAGLAIATGGLLRDGISHLALADHLGAALAHRATGYASVYIIEIIMLLATIIVLGPLVGRSQRLLSNKAQGPFGLSEFPT